MRRLLLLAALLLGACDQRMAEQPSHRPYDAAPGFPAPGFPDGRAMQAPPDHTVARDEAAERAALASRPPMSASLLARGRERFGIHCAPCHGRDGNGTGMIVQRGFPNPPSYFEERLRTTPDGHILSVIADGYGAMYGYGDRVPAADRWAILAYIRALQTSRGVAVARLPAPLRARLEDLP